MGLLAKAWKNVDHDMYLKCQKLSEEDKKEKEKENVSMMVLEKKEKKEKKEHHISGYNIYMKEKYGELKKDGKNDQSYL